MNVIRKGLKDKVDVSIYAKPEINCWQMEKIKIGLEENKFNTLIYGLIKW